MRELRDLYDEFGNKTELTYYKGDEIPKGYYPMVVMIAIENSDGKFLMQRRVPEKGGDYGVTGGHPKSGETPYEGIITNLNKFKYNILKGEIYYVLSISIPISRLWLPAK